MNKRKQFCSTFLETSQFASAWTSLNLFYVSKHCNVKNVPFRNSASVIFSPHHMCAVFIKTTKVEDAGCGILLFEIINNSRRCSMFHLPPYQVCNCPLQLFPIQKFIINRNFDDDRKIPSDFLALYTCHKAQCNNCVLLAEVWSANAIMQHVTLAFHFLN